MWDATGRCGGGWGESSPEPPAASSENPFAGAFKGEKLSGDFKVNDGQVTGTISLNNQNYPVTGTVRDGKLSGTFEAGGAKFSFVATVEGDSMSFETDGTKYAMKKQVAAPVNPLGRPRNPLDP